VTAKFLLVCYVRGKKTARRSREGLGAPMTEEEMLEKLKQIEEQARMTLNELPRRLAKDRLRLVIGLAQYMQTGIMIAQSKRSDARFAPTPAADTPQ
jgi:hypothetical protein